MAITLDPPFYVNQRLDSPVTGHTFYVLEITWNHSGQKIDPNDHPIKHIKMLDLTAGEIITVFYPVLIEKWKRGTLVQGQWIRKELGFPVEKNKAA